MIIFNSVVLAIMLITAMGWEIVTDSDKIRNLLNFFLSLFLFYLAFLFGMSVFHLVNASNVNDMLNHNIKDIVYIIIIIQIIRISAIKQK
ncbi:hypothetical protein MN141_07190 [Streptococcus agalactiae]|uniref:hypothetical protein n=1 Tax=Streptococcus agalactiae TaxID=1311 RepID=UPI001F4ED28A|nr:hypothetical protein [Streptococcus agalactiae]MCH9591285.1 hypothetical protein [Streptococcus agalactiae]